MESAKYFILVGALLFIMAISPGMLKKLPITSSVIYLLFGILLGSHGFGILSLDHLENAKAIELISELTVLISLFTVGLKLRLDLTDRLWLLPLSLATLSMVLTISLIALLAHFFLGMGPGHAILLGAIISPTDPVLASEVQLSDPNDRNLRKFVLTSEGGMNDGTAFPFVMLGLFIIGVEGQDWSLGQWVYKDLLWAIGSGLLIGVAWGIIVSKITAYIKVVRNSFYLEDFLTISSIAVSYGIAIQVHGYGFLAVFANALTIRQIELRRTIKRSEHPTQDLPDNVLSFNEQLERIFEVVSVGIVGLLIDFRTFSFDCVVVALTTILLIRPVSVFAGTLFSRLNLRDKLFLSWFGVRGIGSVYYLFFSLNVGKLPGGGEALTKYTLWTILFSIFIHGVSIKLILKRYGSKKQEASQSAVAREAPEV